MDMNNEKNGFVVLIGGLAAIAILMVDVIFTSEPQMAIPKCLLMTVAFVILALVKFKDKAKLKASFAVAGIFVVAGLFAYAFPAFNDITAKSAAGEIIKAAESYKAKTGAYPQKLEDLRPAFISKIPRAKYTVLWSNFYILDGNLVYVNTPPFDLRQYAFADGKWTWCGSGTFAKILSLPKN